MVSQWDVELGFRCRGCIVWSLIKLYVTGSIFQQMQLLLLEITIRYLPIDAVFFIEGLLEMGLLVYVIHIHSPSSSKFSQENVLLMPKIYRFFLIQRLKWGSIPMQGLRFICLTCLVTQVRSISFSFEDAIVCKIAEVL